MPLHSYPFFFKFFLVLYHVTGVKLRLFFLPGPGYRSSSKAFLYSLYNTYGYNPRKLGLKSGHSISATYTHTSYGPTFGGGRHDIYTRSNRGRTYCDRSYAIPSGYPSRGSCWWLAGSHSFTLSDIEVFYEVT